MSDDPYVYPGTDVLRNMRGIRDGDELEKFETRLTYLRGLQLASDPLVGGYDLSHLGGSTATSSPGSTSGPAS